MTSKVVKMTWREFVDGLRPEQRDKILYQLLAWQLNELLHDSDIAFTEGEDPDYQGTYTVNADIYWRSCGVSLLHDASKCSKCGKPSEGLHTCPYAEEINDDHTSLCNCCKACTHECCMDV